jgi:hypothetical protein
VCSSDLLIADTISPLDRLSLAVTPPPSRAQSPS